MKDYLDPEMRQRIMAAVRASKKPKALRCAYCEQTMEGYGQRRYCSAACRLKAFRERHKDEPRQRPPAPPAEEG